MQPLGVALVLKTRGSLKAGWGSNPPSSSTLNFGVQSMKNKLDKEIYMEDINSVVTDTIDCLADKLAIDIDDDNWTILHDFIIDEIDRMCEYPDYRNYN